MRTTKPLVLQLYYTLFCNIYDINKLIKIIFREKTNKIFDENFGIKLVTNSII